MSDIDQITQLVLQERQGRDRAWWAQMRGCFHEDSTVRLSWFDGNGYDFTAGSQKMSERGNKVLHRLSPPVIHARESRAVVELPCCAEARTMIHDTEIDLTAYSRLLYRVEQRGGVWKIASLDAIYERDTMAPTIPGVQLRVDTAVIARIRPSYRFVGYHLHTMGVTIKDDLFGDDRPDAVNALYRAAFAWAGMKIEA